MCGIVGYIGKRDVAPLLLEGLQRLEYRGYDSAGIVVNSPKSSALKVVKAKGRVRELESRVPKRFAGTTGIAHTRWATHGAPSDINSHPHLDADSKVAVVHNGIVDNADELRAKLVADGVVFVSETDTEVLVHLIARAQADSLEEKVREALKVVEGTYGIAVMHADFADRIVVARNGSPVVLGIGEKEMFVASDVAALVAHTRQVVTLGDGEMATLKADDFRTYTTSGTKTTATPETVEWEAASYDMGGHDTYMHKEISEQPDAVDRVLRGRIDDRFNTVHLGGLNLDPREARGIRRVKILGCGTSYHAGLIGAGLIEGMARIPADAEPASEFRYRNPVVDPDTLYIAVSQSGETYDVLAAVQELKRKGARVLGVVNVVGSAIAREADGGVYVHMRPRGLRRLHQVLHQHGRGLRAARRAPRPDPGPVGHRRQADHRGPAQAARPDRGDPQGRGGHQEAGGRVRRGQVDDVHRPGARLPGGAGGLPEAQGDLLHPRRGLPGLRAQARPARAHRAA